MATSEDIKMAVDSTPKRGRHGPDTASDSSSTDTVTV
jgi:hypothetical protein